MTKAALIAKVAVQIQLPKKQTNVIIHLFFTSITDALSRGGNVLRLCAHRHRCGVDRPAALPMPNSPLPRPYEHPLKRPTY